MRTLLVAFAAYCLLASCDRDEDPAPVSETPPAAKLSMKMNGVLWTSEKNTTASVAFLSSDGQTDQVIVKGATNSGDNFQLTTAKEISGPGTYEIPSTTGGGIQLTNSSAAYSVSTAGGPATITITEIKTIGSSKYVKGTFEGTIKKITNNNDTIVITEGVFNGID
jgi:hypothetical protein